MIHTVAHANQRVDMPELTYTNSNRIQKYIHMATIIDACGAALDRPWFKHIHTHRSELHASR